VRKIIVGVMAMAAGVLGPAVTPAVAGTGTTASAGLAATLTITGHGWGHGRGMGQYGAYGYALLNQSWQWILGHYYQGTTLVGDTSAGIAPNANINVHLSELDGASAIVVSGNGLMVDNVAVASPHVVTRSPTGDRTVTAAGPVTVSGPWSNGPIRAFDGAIVVKAAVAQVWNVVGVEQYVDGVVPRESPAGWTADGSAALKAQAVAARSYALAIAGVTVPGGGTICDGGNCQVYGGVPDQYGLTADAAVAATSGLVLVCNAGSTCGPPGSIAHTEFSSSTGGYSAGGAFPAVVDAGDSVPGNGNPNGSWTVQRPVTDIGSAYPSIGSPVAITVTARNGYGEWGGRVLQMVVTGTAGHVTVTGDSFAAALGLKSDWFTVVTPDSPSGGDDGYWLLDQAGRIYPFGRALSYGSMAGQVLNAPIIGMAPSPDQQGYWLVGSDGGIFSFGDAHFYGSTGGEVLNEPVLGLAPSANGQGYWLFAGDGGIFTFGDAVFYGSTGALHLNQPIVGMATTPDGDGYWLVASDGGIFTFGDAGFYGSTGGMRLNQPIVGMVPTADGHGYTLVARDGGIFTFGDAQYVGSLPGLGVSAQVAAVAPTADGGGYLVLTSNGSIIPFGDAPYLGDLQTSVAGWSGTAIAVFAHRQP
jgi:SpoIID/LytB domain protein